MFPERFHGTVRNPSLRGKSSKGKKYYLYRYLVHVSLCVCVCLNVPRADVFADSETKEVSMLKRKQRMRAQGFKRERRVKERRRLLPQLDEDRSWKRARRQEKHKDAGPLQRAAKLPFSDRPVKTARLPFQGTCVTVCVTHAARLHVKGCGMQHKRLPETRTCLENS